MTIGVLIAGAAGQVAQSMMERAKAADVEAIALGRPTLDLTAPETIDVAIDQTEPVVVVNAAAYTAVDKAESDETLAFALNADGAGALAKSTAIRQLPLIHLSTDYVFDGAKSNPYTEDDPVAPLGVYGKSKLAGEQQVVDANSSYVIIRTSWVYSPFGANFVKTMLRLAETCDEVTVVADQIGAPTSALDIADGVFAVARRLADDAPNANTGVFHMTAAGEASWADFAEEIFKVSRAAGGPAARVKPIRTEDYPTPAKRPANSRLDCAKIEAAYRIALPDWRASVPGVVRRLLETGEWRP